METLAIVAKQIGYQCIEMWFLAGKMKIFQLPWGSNKFLEFKYKETV